MKKQPLQTLQTLYTVLFLQLLVFSIKFKPLPFIVLGGFFCTFLILSVYSSSLNSFLFSETLAQSDVEVVRYKNLTIDLGDGISTNAQLSYPAIGKGPFPGVLLIHGSGANDMNETGGLILFDDKTGSKIYPDYQGFFQIAEYLSERGFAVLKYDKRGITSNFTIYDNVWGNVTFNDLKQDAERALSVLLEQPEVNASKKATLIGHSEGSMIAPRVAVDNPDKVKNTVMMGAAAHSLKDLIYFQIVTNPVIYAEKILDKNRDGMLSLKEGSEDFIFQVLVGGNLTHLLLVQANPTGHYDRTIQVLDGNDYTISIEDELKPLLIATYKNITSPSASALTDKCRDLVYGYFEWNGGLEGCPIWMRSHSDLESTLSMIGNVSSGTSILILQGENDTATPVEQAMLLQQRLTEVNHPDHKLITYPDLGHSFYPSNQWMTESGRMQEYVLADLYSWLEDHSRW